MFGWEGSVNLSAWRSRALPGRAQARGVGGPGEPPGGAARRQAAGLLLLRTTRQVRVSPNSGRSVFRHCRQLLDNLYEAELAVGTPSGGAPGSLRITAPVSHGESRIAPW